MNSKVAGPPSPVVPEISLRTWVAVLGSVVGCFMAGMNVHVTNAALPDVRGSLGATFEEGSWITTAYLVAEIIIIPMTGWLVSIFSMRRVMVVGTAGFVVFSIACSLAPNIQTMILARALQGAFGGVLIPLSFQLIVTELPAARHPLGMALFAVANNVAQAAGPSLGGWLADVFSWRWIFYLQVPPGVLLLAAIGWSVRPRPVELRRLRQGDWWGMATMAVGLSALQILLEEGERYDWFASPAIVYCACATVVSLAAFVLIELRREHPFINLRLLGRYNFGIASLMQFTFGAVVFGVVFLVPNYFSEIHDYNARQIGLLMIPYGLVQFVMSFATPRLMRWTSARTVIVAGFLITGLGCLMNVSLNIDAAANVIVPSLVVRGIGQSLVVVALGVMAVQGLEKAEIGSASGLFSMVRNVGGAIGIALFSQVVVDRGKFHAQRIGESVTLFAQATQERLAALGNVFAHGGVGSPPMGGDAAVQPFFSQAVGLVARLVQRDALLLSYSDAFLLAGVAMMACVLVGLCLRRR
ncbi:MDR family MFS transporter [Achromobacter aloeverae]|uniref:EmrB/QacA family drug resistance transporter n=1 Tax=Achromobacter aloeverae TaxID=1750518 RepID=A0A4Q1HF48_9BURK|nr:MDR family MFS transporter [Achromobacter aloeverae]RXN84427.1 EmrB/QacA family drug resistance transporter [Achromobacter aloeverae]